MAGNAAIRGQLMNSLQDLMVQGNFGGDPDELERIRQFAMNMPDAPQRNMLLAALANNQPPQQTPQQMMPQDNYDPNTGSFRQGGQVSNSNGTTYRIGGQEMSGDMAKAALMEKLRGTQNSPDFNAATLDALYDPQTGTFRSGGAVKDEQTGRVTALGGAPRPSGPVATYGIGQGGLTQLSPSGDMPEADYSRVQVTVPGLGKGHYSKDGQYVVGTGPNGSQWKALIGYDKAATQQNQVDSLNMDKLRLGNEKTQAEIANLNLKPISPEKRPTLTEVVDPSDPNRMIRVDANLYDGGTLGAQGVFGISGKEPTAAKREEKSAQGKEQLAAAIDSMRANLDLLRDAGGMVSNDKDVSTNALARLRSSALGQGIGGIVGTKEQTARKELDSSRLQLLTAIKDASGMSSQQLNSNVELKTWLDSLGSTKSDYESNSKILDNLEDIYLRGKGNKSTLSVNASRQMPVNAGEAIFEAKKAIAKGHNKAGVIRELEKMGVTNHGL